MKRNTSQNFYSRNNELRVHTYYEFRVHTNEFREHTNNELRVHINNELRVQTINVLINDFLLIRVKTSTFL